MELRYPLLLLLIPIILFFTFFNFKKGKEKYTSGSKIANTEYIKNTSYYKNIIKKYKLFKILIFIFFLSTLISSTILVSRIAKVETISKNEYNRDIFICMDVSTSVNELNLELVDNLKNTVKELKGERIGISIFNTSSVVLVPLTDDYNYLLETLDKIHNSISNYNNMTSIYDRNYLYSGTIEDNKTRGSSLIGDGWASCVYSFSNLEEKRTRIIILSTDNDLQGTPLLTIDEASDISASKNIKVYGIGTKNMKEENKNSFKNAIEKNNGKFYIHSQISMNNIINDINTTSKTYLKKNTETKKVDMPTIPFIILIISLIGFMLSSKKVLS